MQGIHERGLRACAILSVLLAACESPRMGPGVEPERVRPADARIDPAAGAPVPGPDAADLGPAPEPPEPPTVNPGPDGGALPPGACTPGDKQCGPASFPETCSTAGVWVPEAQACPYICQGRGVCGGECQPGTRKCGDPPGALTPYLCDEGGRWRAEAPCQNLCSSGSCAGSCSPGAGRCDGTRRQMCSDVGTWETIETCPFVCSGGGQCTGECKPSTRSCSGNTPRACDETGRWVPGNTCQSPANGSVRCEGGACAVTCPDGMCGSGCCQCNDNGDCPGRACVNGACVGECAPTTRSCSGNTPQTCNDLGRWVSGNACQAPQYGSARCDGGNCGISCPNGTCGSNTCCECNANSDCTAGTRRACMSGRCVESVIRNVSYVVEGNPDGQKICMNANPPAGCTRRKLNIQKCDGQTGRCTIKIAWSDSFGGGGELGDDPCPFIVKNAIDVKYTCSHDGGTRDAGDFRPPASPSCEAGLLGTAVLSCP